VDENNSMDELKQEDYKDFQENAELKAIIAGQQAKSCTLDVNGIEIKFKAAIPKGLRDRLIKVARQYEMGEVEKADEEIYEILAQICINPPFTNPKSWKYIDLETGEVPNLMQSMIEKITKLEGAAKSFRNHR